MSFGVTELLVILAIVILLFGTKKLKTLGSDLGSAIKGFRKAVDNEDSADAEKSPGLEADAREDTDPTLIPDKDPSETKN
ncbi:MAG: twin-arginine translocase TatA/TatE family subunit [Gammaproteobacteria bacterium]|nr:twin-arginine translocase TatA/TatE family subunit [Gammaproteobacteria bacterium]